jgi:hypothetical protein
MSDTLGQFIMRMACYTVHEQENIVVLLYQTSRQQKPYVIVLITSWFSSPPYNQVLLICPLIKLRSKLLTFLFNVLWQNILCLLNREFC